MRLCVLASHEGTTLQALIEAYAVKSDPIVALVVSNNSESGALRRARAGNIPTAHLSSKTCSTPEALDAAIVKVLREHEIDLVVLAGYMKKLGPQTVSAFKNRILNTHPALLPKFAGNGMFGLHVHKAVLEAKETVTGASVHIVTAEYDAGPVIAQREVPVYPADTAESLSRRVQACERALLVDVVFGIASGRIKVPDL
jgi:phosphoribosylglycinamide formyltransferase 1